MAKEPSQASPSLADARRLVSRVAEQLLVTKVVATRSVNGGRNGSTFLGYSAAWRATQDDGGGEPAASDADDMSGRSVTGMTLKEAAVAAILLGRTVDIQAHKNAAAGGNISEDYCRRAVKAISHNYGQLLAEVMGEVPPPSDKE